MQQIIVNAIITSGLLAIVSWSFGIIFNTTKIFHLAHGVIYTLAVYFFILFNDVFHLWFLSTILALGCTIIVALLMEWLVYRHLFIKGVNQNITLLSSIGLQIIGVNLIALLFGNDIKMINIIKNYSFEFGNIIITKIQFIQLGVSIIILISLYLFFRHSNLGLKIKAVSSKSEIASVLGINVLKIRNIVFIVGSLVAGVSAILSAADTGIDPNSGMNIVLSAIVVVILNRKDNILGIVIVSVFISILNNLTEWYFSSDIKVALIYFILIIALLLRTERVLEYKIRTEAK